MDIVSAPLGLDSSITDVRNALRHYLEEVVRLTDANAQTMIDMLDLKMITLVDNRTEGTLDRPTLPLHGLSDDEVKAVVAQATEKLTGKNITMQTRDEAKAMLPVLKLLVTVLENALAESETLEA